MSVYRISKVIAEKISKEKSLSDSQKLIIEFGAQLFLSQLLSVTLLIAAGYFLNILEEVIILAICSALLRKYSGGAHCSSPLRCALLSIIIVPLLVFVGQFIYKQGQLAVIIAIALSALISAILIYRYAPKDSPSKPIKNPDKIRTLKLKSICACMLLLSITGLLVYIGLEKVGLLIVLGLLNQALTLTKFGQTYVELFDKLLAIAF